MNTLHPGRRIRVSEMAHRIDLSSYGIAASEAPPRARIFNERRAPMRINQRPAQFLPVPWKPNAAGRRCVSDSHRIPLPPSKYDICCWLLIVHGRDW